MDSADKDAATTNNSQTSAAGSGTSVLNRTPGLIRDLVDKTAAAISAQHVDEGEWGNPKSVLWRWIRGGTGTTKHDQDGEYEDKGETPLSLSPPARAGGDGRNGVVLRAKANPKVNVELGHAGTNVSNDSQSYLANDAQQFHLQSPESLAEDRIKLLEGFCVAEIGSKTSLKTTSSGIDTSSAELENELIRKLEKSSCADAFALLFACVRESTEPWSLSDLSSKVSDTFVNDSGAFGPFSADEQQHAGEGNVSHSTCQSARLLVLFYMLVTFDENTMTGTAINSLKQKWSAAGGREAPEENEEMSYSKEVRDRRGRHCGDEESALLAFGPQILSFAGYLSDKAEFLKERAPLFEGHFSLATFLRRMDIESADDVRKCVNEDLMTKELLRSTTLDSLLCLLASLQSALETWRDRSEASACLSAPQRLSLMESIDSASCELMKFCLALEVFQLCHAIQWMEGNGVVKAGSSDEVKKAMALVWEYVSKADAKSMAAKFIRIGDECGDYELDFSFLLGKRQESAPLKVWRSKGNGTPSRRTKWQKMRPTIESTSREIECTFSTFAGLHAAIGKEIDAIVSRRRSRS